MTQSLAPEDGPLATLPAMIERLQTKHPIRTEAEQRQWLWDNEIVPHLIGSQLPQRFWYQATKWKPKQFEVFKQVNGLLKGNGAIIALVGKRGTGKTTICAQIILERAFNEGLVCPWHRRPPYRKLAKLVAQYKSIYSDHGSIDTEQLLQSHDQLCVHHPLVVIDECHDCDELRVKNRFLTDTIDKRYSANNDTILISNQTPEQFQETTDASVLSRLKETGCVIECTWESWR